MKPDLAIEANGIAKSYRIGASQVRYRTFREALVRAAGAPVRRLRAMLHDSGEDQTQFWALRDVSFELQKGEVLGVIGRNGAGKSTLLKILSRVTPPTSGRISIRGRVGSLLEVGTGFHPELSGRENVFLNGAILGMRRQEIVEKFDEIVEFAEVGKFIDTPVKRFSSGMYLRLAFAVAAHLEPEVLVVDEVLAVGDTAFQKKCLGKMESVAGQGRTILFVSHNLAAIASLCSKAILLEGGRLKASGPTSEIVAGYLSSVTGSAASISWPDANKAPGNDGVKLTYVRLIDELGQLCPTVDIERPVTLQIGYHVERPVGFRIAASFHTQGSCAFTTLENREAQREVGDHETSVTIPGQLLAEGDYLVTISAFASRGKKNHLFKADGCVAFQVFDPLTGSSARGDYREGLGGVMRPKLAWSSRAVVDASRESA